MTIMESGARCTHVHSQNQLLHHLRGLPLCDGTVVRSVDIDEVFRDVESA